MLEVEKKSLRREEKQRKLNSLAKEEMEKMVKGVIISISLSFYFLFDPFRFFIPCVVLAYTIHE